MRDLVVINRMINSQKSQFLSESQVSTLVEPGLPIHKLTAAQKLNPLIS